MLDSSRKSLEQFNFASSMRNSLASRERLIPEVFAAICWFHELRWSLKASTVISVQCIIEPAHEENAKAVRRRWMDYKNGRHTPSPAVVSAAEKFVPGSKEILHSPLWKALRLDNAAEKIAQTLFGQTCKAGDDLLAWILRSKNAALDPRGLSSYCRAMVSHGSLEGLAVLIICIRLADRSSANRLVTLYRYAADCLLILGSWFYAHGIALSLAEYYEKILLPACSFYHWMSPFSSAHYLRSIQIFERAVQFEIEQTGQILNRDKWILAGMRLLKL